MGEIYLNVVKLKIIKYGGVSIGSSWLTKTFLDIFQEKAKKMG